MRSQMRLAAALWALNFFTGCTPGRLLQIATSRFAGQDLASSANSGWLLKLSNGVVVAAAASSGVACAVMLLWVSIVKVVIVICPLFRQWHGHQRVCQPDRQSERRAAHYECGQCHWSAAVQ